MNRHVLCLLVAVAVCCSNVHAETLRLVCESWHPRLGQTNDFALAIDLEAKRCNGEPCTITDNEFSWTAQGGRYVGTVNRLTREGRITRRQRWADAKGAEGLPLYRNQKNLRSIDGLPSLEPEQ
jgi:hypothetical protein